MTTGFSCTKLASDLDEATKMVLDAFLWRSGNSRRGACHFFSAKFIVRKACVLLGRRGRWVRVLRWYYSQGSCFGRELVCGLIPGECALLTECDRKPLSQRKSYPFYQCFSQMCTSRGRVALVGTHSRMHMFRPGLTFSCLHRREEYWNVKQSSDCLAFIIAFSSPGKHVGAEERRERQSLAFRTEGLLWDELACGWVKESACEMKSCKSCNVLGDEGLLGIRKPQL